MLHNFAGGTCAAATVSAQVEWRRNRTVRSAADALRTGPLPYVLTKMTGIQEYEMSEMSFQPIVALSPLDGRYAGRVDALRAQFSEYGLIRRRLEVEIGWLKALAAEPHFAEIPPFSAQTSAALDALVAGFSPAQAVEVKAIEAETNHDVKALEYWIKKALADTPEVIR